VRWVSFKGEYAWLSIGGMPTGIVAIGGVARGIVAIGGVFSAGVISVSMNAVGSFAAFGMNAAAPLSFSLINGVGVVTAAGINGWGLLTWAGVNASGLSGQGGVNWSANVGGPIVVILGLVIASLAMRGEWAPRRRSREASLASFLADDRTGDARVRATLRSTRPQAVDLKGAGVELSVEAKEAVATAARRLGTDALVIATLSRVLETSPDGEAGDYREGPPMTTRAVVRCVQI
jgi:hypothetical protein